MAKPTAYTGISRYLRWVYWVSTLVLATGEQ